MSGYALVRCIFLTATSLMVASAGSAEPKAKAKSYDVASSQTTVVKYSLVGVDDGTTYNAAQEFDVQIGDPYTVDQIVSVVVFVDTDGLGFYKAECDNHNSAWCLDNLKFEGKNNFVEDWGIENDAYPAEKQVTGPGPDFNEDRHYYDSQNQSHLADARTAVASGLVKLTVEPSTGDTYKVHAVWVQVEFTTPAQKNLQKVQRKQNP